MLNVDWYPKTVPIKIKHLCEYVHICANISTYVHICKCLNYKEALIYSSENEKVAWFTKQPEMFFLVMDSFPVCAKGDKSFKHVFQRCGKWQPGVSQNNLFYSRLGNAIVLPECEEEEVENSLLPMAALTPLYFGVRWS